MKLTQCFKTLNVKPGDEWGTVKKSYHLLAKQYHPDLHPSNMVYENKLKEVTRAFKTLENHYRFQEKNQSETNFRKRPGPSTINGNPPEPEMEHRDNFTAQPQGSSLDAEEKNGRWNRWTQGLRTNLTRLERKIFFLDIRKDIQIHPHTATHGGMVKIRKGKKTFQVKIPPGSWNRMSLRIPERGEASLFGKKRGDLLLNIQVLHSEKPDTGDSSFHYEIKVPREKIQTSRVLTLDSVCGPIKFVLPRKTRDGQKFVLKFQPKDKASPSSNHVVKVHLV